MKKTNMINCRDIIRLRFDLGLTHRQIASSTGVARGTVANVLKRVTEAGLGHWPLPKDLDETALRARLYTSGGDNKALQQHSPDWDGVIKGLNPSWHFWGMPSENPKKIRPDFSFSVQYVDLNDSQLNMLTAFVGVGPSCGFRGVDKPCAIV